MTHNWPSKENVRSAQHLSLQVDLEVFQVHWQCASKVEDHC